jgi:phenylalanine-4-hydroxylase
MRGAWTLTETIPAHLLAWTVEQRPELYTAIDHAVWRYVLGVSGEYFARTAHPAYVEGLAATGLNRERVPRIGEMDACMRRLGWRAVAVSGFVPPQVFMEFQSLGILPIACDMRLLEHLLYTPAPDVIHEAAGHAPIIADPDYRDFLRAFGEVSLHAIHNDQDMALYRAIRRLSELKEEADADPVELQRAEQAFADLSEQIIEPSEAGELARMYWWTVEYGLVGSLEDPRIYGAGLLSSAGESYRCLAPEVRKRPLDLECVRTPYDITRPQPQLFVAEDFARLRAVLEEYAATMAWRLGGRAALDKALAAKAPTTTTLDSGLQIGGVLRGLIEDDEGAVAYLQYGGPVLLAAGGSPLRGHGRETHAEGFGSPLGRLKGQAQGAGQLDGPALRRLGFGDGRVGRLEFASGVCVEGRLEDIEAENGSNLLLSFSDCRVTLGERLLFDPAWGRYDMACGLQARSVQGGWVDRVVDPEDLPRERPRQRTTLCEANRELVPLYASVRKVRESGGRGALESRSLLQTCARLDADWPGDWLLRLELEELAAEFESPAWAAPVTARLDELAARGGELNELIGRGRALRHPKRGAAE